MSAAPEVNPVPFFEDTRTILEKLHVDKRNWIPAKPEEECPATIYGLVLERGSQTDMNDDEVPTVVLLSDDLKTEWRIVAYHGYLSNAILRQDPRAGDYLLAAFKGRAAEALRKGESAAYLYDVIVERDPSSPYASQTVPQPTPPPALPESSDVGFDPGTEAEVTPAADDDIPF